MRGLRKDQHDHRCRTLSGGQQRRVDLALGIIASGIISTTFNNLTISMAFERQTGVLKRLAGTPNLGIGVLVLTAWLVGAFVLTLRTFGFVDDR